MSKLAVSVEIDLDTTTRLGCMGSLNGGGGGECQQDALLASSEQHEDCDDSDGADDDGDIDDLRWSGDGEVGLTMLVRRSKELVCVVCDIAGSPNTGLGQVWAWEISVLQ